MAETLDIRWRQRFQNFQNALKRLSEAEKIIGAALGGILLFVAFEKYMIENTQ